MLIDADLLTRSLPVILSFLGAIVADDAMLLPCLSDVPGGGCYAYVMNGQLRHGPLAWHGSRNYCSHVLVSTLAIAMATDDDSERTAYTFAYSTDEAASGNYR